MIDDQFQDLVKHARTLACEKPQRTDLPNGGAIIEIAGLKVKGWNRQAVNLLFLVPPGFPSGPPDCFWIEPGGFRLADGGTPINSNDANPIPGDTNPTRNTTWFSWHVQSWNPSRDTLLTYLNVILSRLDPAR